MPVPPLVEVTGALVFTNVPGALVFTAIESVQPEPVAIVPALMLTDPEPATAVAVPPHVFASPFGVATTSPAGSVSVNATPVAPTVLAVGFVIVNVNVEVPFCGTVPGVNDAAIDGGATTTCGLVVSEPVPPTKSVLPA